jgi:hypothetical protein
MISKKIYQLFSTSFPGESATRSKSEDQSNFQINKKVAHKLDWILIIMGLLFFTILIITWLTFTVL